MGKDSNIHVAVIGAGPAGLMAAIHSARLGANVCVIERNSNAGKKLLLTGGGRCNLTHAGSREEFLNACRPYHNLLKPALYQLSQEQLLEFFHRRGEKTYTEPDGCVFPQNGTAARIRKVLLEEAASLGVTFFYDRRVEMIHHVGGCFRIQYQQGDMQSASVIVACGGVSWPQTGSSGDGYRFAKELGHTVRAPVGIICPVVCRESWPGTLRGTAIPKVAVRIKGDSRKNSITGAMVFTERGIGGPAAFEVSRLLADALDHGRTLSATLDFCPDQEENKLEKWFIEECTTHSKKEVSVILSKLLPRRLAELLVSMVFGQRKMTGPHVSKIERLQLIQHIKQIPLTFTTCGPLEKATVTRGGINFKEVDFKTMQSRVCPGLYFAGEVLDVDGPCGGYNLQIAFSTGALAGTKAARTVLDSERRIIL